MECSICYDKMIGGSTPDKSVMTTPCGHLFHDKCLKEYINKREEENINKPQNQKVAPKCPLCNSKLTLSSIFKIHLNVDNNSSINEQLILTRISDINITMEKNEKVHGEMYQQILNSMATMNESFKKFEYQNDMLRRENADLKTGSDNLPKGDTVALKEQMKTKDFMVANLQKEVTELKSKRAETTREMNTIREQINHLKAAAKGEKRNPAVESKSQSLTLKFDDFSDKLIIE